MYGRMLPHEHVVISQWWQDTFQFPEMLKWEAKRRMLGSMECWPLPRKYLSIYHTSSASRVICCSFSLPQWSAEVLEQEPEGFCPFLVKSHSLSPLGLPSPQGAGPVHFIPVEVPTLRVSVKCLLQNSRWSMTGWSFHWPDWLSLTHWIIIQTHTRLQQNGSLLTHNWGSQTMGFRYSCI